jgi:hypothetical protein
MGEYFALLAIVAPVFFIAGTGFFLRRVKVLTEEADTSIMKVLVNVFYPCLLFRFVYGNPALQDMGNVIMAPAAGFGLICLGFIIAYLAAPLLGLKVGKGRRTFSMTVGIFNYGYLPIPLILALYDERTAGVLAVFNLGVEIAFWTVGVLLVSGAGLKEGLRRVINGPSIAILLALTLNFTLGPGILPEWVSKTIWMLSDAAIPVALVLVGATMADLAPRMDLKRSWRVGLGAVALRLGIIPVLMVVLAIYLPASEELKRVILVQAAMPAGAFPVIVARHYGGSTAVAIQVVISTTLISLLTIPLWLKVGQWVLER